MTHTVKDISGTFTYKEADQTQTLIIVVFDGTVYRKKNFTGEFTFEECEVLPTEESEEFVRLLGSD